MRHTLEQQYMFMEHEREYELFKHSMLIRRRALGDGLVYNFEEERENELSMKFTNNNIKLKSKQKHEFDQMILKYTTDYLDGKIVLKLLNILLKHCDEIKSEYRFHQYY